MSTPGCALPFSASTTCRVYLPNHATTMSHIAPEKQNNATAFVAPDWVNIVRTKVNGLRYGVVQIIVHDGQVTQIEHTEKTRIVAPREY